MLVVKGEVGVFVTGGAITSVGQGQALAAALVPGM
jgi:CTP synthase (UTP-ammonia lyase)